MMSTELVFAAEWALDWLRKHDPECKGIISALEELTASRQRRAMRGMWERLMEVRTLQRGK